VKSGAKNAQPRFWLARRRHVPNWLAIAAILATLILLHFHNPGIGRWFGSWESQYYVHAVTGPLVAPIDKHYGYRLLPAVILGYIPLSISEGFIVCDYVSLFLAAYLLFTILCCEGIIPTIALLGSFIFLTAPCSTQWLLAYSANVDAFYLLLIAASYRAIQLRRWELFSFVLLIGTFTKVTIWVMAFVAAASIMTDPKQAASPGRRKLSAVFWLAALVPSVLVKFLVERIWPATGSYSYLRDIAHNLKLKFFVTSVTFPHLPQIAEFPASFLVVFGIVAIVFALHFRLMLHSFREKPALIVFLVGTMGLSFAGGYDDARYMPFVAVPVLYVFADILQKNLEMYARPWMLGYIVVATLILSDLLNPDPANYERYMPHYASWASEAPFLLYWTGLLAAGFVLKSLTTRYARGSANPACFR